MGSTTTAWQDRLISIAQIVVPTGICAALLFYIGVVRNRAFYSYFGLDGDLLGLSPAQEMLQSVDAIVSVLIALVILTISYLLYRACYKISVSSALSTSIRFSVGAIGVLILVAEVVGLVGGSRSSDFRYTGLCIPTLLGLAVVVLLLVVQVLAVRPPVPTALSVLGPTLVRSGVILFAAIVAGVVTFVTTDYSGSLGRMDAESVAKKVIALPSSIIYSKEELSISDIGVFVSGPPSVADLRAAPKADTVDAQSSSGDKGGSKKAADSAGYPFTYAGLRVLTKAGDRWFLISGQWQSGRSRIIVLPDVGADIRIEFQS